MNWIAIIRALPLALALGLLVSLRAAPFETNVFVSTVAGSGFTGLVDGEGTDTMFSFPSYLAGGTSGVYVYDSGNQRIRFVSDSGLVSTLFATFRKLEFNNPIPLVEHRGTLHFAEQNKIYSATDVGFSLVCQLPSRVRLVSLASVNGRMFGCDRVGNQVYAISNNVSFVFAGSGDDSSIDGKGIFSSFEMPIGISSGPKDIFVSQYRALRRIALVPPNEVSTVAAEIGFSPIQSVASTDDGTLIFTDESTIRRATLDGHISTLAGSNDGFIDGAGANAKFKSPQALVIKNNEIWVADTYNHRIRKISVNSTPPVPAPINIGLFAGITINGAVGQTFRIEATQGLSDTNSWSAVATLTLSKTAYTWFDENSPGPVKRFYRAVLLQ